MNKRTIIAEYVTVEADGNVLLSRAMGSEAIGSEDYVIRGSLKPRDPARSLQNARNSAAAGESYGLSSPSVVWTLKGDVLHSYIAQMSAVVA